MLQIERQVVVPEFGRHVFHAVAVVAPGVVDQHLHGAAPVDQAGQQRLVGGDVGHVAGDGQRRQQRFAWRPWARASRARPSAMLVTSGFCTRMGSAVASASRNTATWSWLGLAITSAPHKPLVSKSAWCSHAQRQDEHQHRLRGAVALVEAFDRGLVHWHGQRLGTICRPASKISAMRLLVFQLIVRQIAAKARFRRGNHIVGSRGSDKPKQRSRSLTTPYSV